MLGELLEVLMGIAMPFLIIATVIGCCVLIKKLMGFLDDDDD